MHHILHLPFSTITTFTFLPLILILSTTTTTATNHHHHHRRLLHQPFFPLDLSQPPLTSPPPPPQPKYPFSTTLPPPDPTTTTTSQNNNPFFPFYPSPPPPPPPPSTTAATFPANISSLVLPSTSSHSHHKPTKLISLVISISLFSTLVFASVLYLLRYHSHRLNEREHDRSLKSDSLRLFPPDTTPSDASDTTKKTPPPAFPCHAPASTSSEFLYLGTVVSSRDANDVGSTAAIHPPAAAAATPVSYERLGSPDLQPLPPLPRHNSHVRFVL